MRNVENPLNSQFKDCLVSPNEFSHLSSHFHSIFDLVSADSFHLLHVHHFNFDGCHIFVEGNLLLI
jgi:hypothetical protein